MSVYNIVAFLHVAAAILWIGAGAGLMLLGTRALKARDQADLAAVMKHVVQLSKTIFMPASIVVLVLGLYLTWYAWGFFQFWVLFGIVGLAASAALGSMMLGPMAKDYAAMDLSGGPTSESTALAERIIAVAKADYVILFTVVFDMVAKPGWGNFITWIIMLAVVAAGVFFFIPRDMLPTRPGMERTRDFGGDDDDDDK